MEQMWMSSLKRQVKMPSRIPSWHRFRKDSSGRVICHNSSPLHVPMPSACRFVATFTDTGWTSLTPGFGPGWFALTNRVLAEGKQRPTTCLSGWTCPPVLCHGSEKNVPQQVAVPGKIKGHEEDLNRACISGPSLLAQSSCLSSLSTSSAYICPRPQIHGWGVWGCLVTQHY